MEVNYYPVLMAWKENKRGMCPLCIRVDLDGKKIGVEMIGQQTKVDDWDAVKKRISGKTHEADLLNTIIENKLTGYRNFILRRQAFGMPLSKEILLQFMKRGKSLECFYEYAENVINTKTLKDGMPYSDETKRRYRDEIHRLQQYAETLSFRQITLPFLNDYKLWMQNTYKKKDGKPLAPNSIWKALVFVQMVYTHAIDKEVILPDGNPFKNFSVGSCETDPDKVKYLEIGQVNAIETVLVTRANTLPELTYKVGWRFLAMCVSGMRISDAMYLEDSYFNDAGDLEFTPYKTRRHKNVAQIPITSDRQRRYLGITMQHKFGSTDHKSFRTTFNIHLKILAAMAGIDINVTSHVGRHTMGGLLVDANIENKAGMAILGVKSENTLKVYQHLKESKLNSEAQKLNNVM